MPNHVYREYDIRGVADRDLTNLVVRGIGQGLGTMLRPNASGAPFRIAVGLDAARAKLGAGSGSGAHA